MLEHAPPAQAAAFIGARGSGCTTPLSTTPRILRSPIIVRAIGALYAGVMSTVVIDVFYENGVFRPVEPVSLPEGSRAKVIATTETEAPAISKTPGVCGGRACVAGTRITVWGLVQHRQLGLSDEAILAAIPGLDRAQLSKAFHYAGEHPEEIARDLAEDQE
jgi:uncharacterized protein (DUF433 family)